MKPTIYIETSIIGYLAMRPGRDLVTAANKQLTYDWWHNSRSEFDLFISQAVVDECSAGDPDAAKERLVFLEGIPLLQSTDTTNDLARMLVVSGPLPLKAKVDAAHLAYAAMNGMDYLLTWNCTHIANPSLRRRIEATCASFGVELPILCTPQELLGEYQDLIGEE